MLDTPEKEAFSLFMFVGTVGPTLGIVSAGAIFDRIGGYLGPKAIPVCCICGLIAVISGLMAAYL